MQSKCLCCQWIFWSHLLTLIISSSVKKVLVLFCFGFFSTFIKANSCVSSVSRAAVLLEGLSEVFECLRWMSWDKKILWLFDGLGGLQVWRICSVWKCDEQYQRPYLRANSRDSISVTLKGFNMLVVAQEIHILRSQILQKLRASNAQILNFPLFLFS